MARRKSSRNGGSEGTHSKDVVEQAMDLLVTPGWVAQHYGVELHRVYRKISQGKLRAYNIRGGSTLVLDVRELPDELD